MKLLFLAKTVGVLAMLNVHTVIAQPTPQPGVGELIEGTTKPVARFKAAYFKPTDAVATFALQRAFSRSGDLPAGYPLQPVFSSVSTPGKADRHRASIAIAAGTSLYGTGEVPGGLLRNGRTVMTWNTDAYGYEISTPSLYQSHPWVLGVRADGTAFGILADTTWRTEIDLAKDISFTAEGNPFPVYVIDRATPQEVCTALMELTGPMPLPPKWALGYHQCRYSYFPEARVREVAEGFRKHEIPASVLWLDIDYMNEYRVFTFDKTRFPDPKKLNADLDAMGFKTIWMIDPGIKAEPGYPIFDDLIKNNFEVKNAKGDSYRGAVWPGSCAFPDYTSNAVRAWWAGLYANFMANGISGVWNDMNEPAIFDVASKTMPEDNQHRGGTYSSGKGIPSQQVSAGDHARFHNVYGMLMAQGTFDGIAAANPQKRPFVLTRAGYMGSHRYAATWTGDNSATWTDLEQSIPMALNLGLSGQPFAGPDIGGFIGNGPGDSTEKAAHFARWLGVGSLLPFCRGHTAKGNIDKEPWAFGADTEKACRLALQRRARLLPYFYTLFEAASRTGVPVVRPAFFADPRDPALRSEDDVFLLGGDVLVVPQFMPDHSRVVVKPGGIWRAFDVVTETHKALPGMFIRGGAIVPVGPIMQWATEKPLDPLTLVVCLDESGQASGALYEDAGDGYAYQQGELLRTIYTAKRVGTTVTVSVASAEGKMARPGRTVEVQLVTEKGVLQGQGKDGSEIVLTVK